MTVRPLRVETRGYSRVGLTISIKAVFLACFAQYLSSDLTSAGVTLSPRLADRAPHHRGPDFAGGSNLLEDRIQTIAEGDHLFPRHF